MRRFKRPRRTTRMRLASTSPLLDAASLASPSLVLQ